jgi:hypothetical protein
VKIQETTSRKPQQARDIPDAATEKASPTTRQQTKKRNGMKNSQQTPDPRIGEPMSKVAFQRDKAKVFRAIMARCTSAMQDKVENMTTTKKKKRMTTKKKMKRMTTEKKKTMKRMTTKKKKTVKRMMTKKKKTTKRMTTKKKKKRALSMGRGFPIVNPKLDTRSSTKMIVGSTYCTTEKLDARSSTKMIVGSMYCMESQGQGTTEHDGHEEQEEGKHEESDNEESTNLVQHDESESEHEEEHDSSQGNTFSMFRWIKMSVSWNRIP